MRSNPERPWGEKTSQSIHRLHGGRRRHHGLELTGSGLHESPADLFFPSLPEGLSGVMKWWKSYISGARELHAAAQAPVNVFRGSADWRIGGGSRSLTLLAGASKRPRHTITRTHVDV